MWYLYFTFLVLFFQEDAIKAEINLELLLYLQRTKIKRLLSWIGKSPTTQIQVVACKPG